MIAAALHARLRPQGFSIQVWTLVSISIAINILALALPIVSQQVYDRVLREHAVSTLTVLIIGLATAILIDAGLRLSRSYLITLNGASFVHQLSNVAIQNLLQSRASNSVPSGVAHALERLNAIRRLKDFNNGQALCLAVDLVFLPVYLALIWYIGGLVVLVPLFVLGLFVALCRFQGTWFAKLMLETSEADQRRYAFLMRTLRAIHSVKALALEHNLARRYEALQESSSRASYGLARVKLSAFGNFVILSNLMTVSVVALCAYQVTIGALSVGGVIAIVLLSGRLLQPVQQGLQLYLQYQDFLQAEGQARAYFPDSIAEAEPIAMPAEDTGRLVIKDLSFTHAASQPRVLDGLSLDLSKGRAIAVHGEAGCGKTTLLKLIAGMHAPAGGQILVNGIEAHRYVPNELLKHVGLISTRGHIFRGSIRDNITRFGKVPYAQALEVADYLDIYGDIAKLPYGMDTFLSDSILDPVTPGLKQMIAILRTLSSKPHIILFDDADFALDQKNYERVYRLLGNIKQNVSMIIVSQDANFRSLADEHFDLSNGRLCESKRF